MELDRVGFFDESERPVRQPFKGSFMNFQLPTMMRVENTARDILSAGKDLGQIITGIESQPKPQEQLTDEQVEARKLANHQETAYRQQESERVNVIKGKEQEAVKMAERFDPQGLFGVEQILAKRASNTAVSRANNQNVGSIAYAVTMERADLIIRSTPEAMENNPALSPKTFDANLHKIAEGGTTMSSTGGNAG